MLAGLLLLSLSAVFVSAESPDKNKDCDGRMITTIRQLDELRQQNCTVIVGPLIIQGLESDDSEYRPSLDTVRQITQFLVIQRLGGHYTSINQLLPNLAVIRGSQKLDNTWALAIVDNPFLTDTGWSPLPVIRKGEALVLNSPQLSRQTILSLVNSLPDVRRSLVTSGLSLRNRSDSCEFRCADGDRACKETSEKCKLGLSVPDHTPYNTTESDMCLFQYTYNGTCVDRCPPRKVLVDDWRCFNRCQSVMGLDKFHVSGNQYGMGVVPVQTFAFNDTCLTQCPEGYRPDISSRKCEVCDMTSCLKRCPAPIGVVTTVRQLRSLEGCTVIVGSLSLSLDVNAEERPLLEDYLGTVEEISGYLLIFRLRGIRSLSFFRNLMWIARSIHEPLLDGRYAFALIDNAGLAHLWSGVKTLMLPAYAEAYVQFNPQLCSEYLTILSDLFDFVDGNEGNSINGICEIEWLSVEFTDVTARSVKIHWKFASESNVTLAQYTILSYLVYYTKSVHTNGNTVAKFHNYNTDNFHDVSDWQLMQFDVKSGDGTTISGLDPASQYQFQVRGYVVSKNQTGVMSNITTVTTHEDVPSRPLDVEIDTCCTTNNVSQVTVSWRKPRYGNGLITGYVVTATRLPWRLTDDVLSSVYEPFRKFGLADDRANGVQNWLPSSEYKDYTCSLACWPVDTASDYEIEDYFDGDTDQDTFLEWLVDSFREDTENCIDDGTFANDTRAELPRLQPFSVYTVKVLAMTSVGCGPSGAYTLVQTAPSRTADLVSGLTATTDTTMVSVSWRRPPSPNGGVIERYHLSLSWVDDGRMDLRAIEVPGVRCHSKLVGDLKETAVEMCNVTTSNATIITNFTTERAPNANMPLVVAVGVTSLYVWPQTLRPTVQVNCTVPGLPESNNDADTRDVVVIVLVVASVVVIVLLFVLVCLFVRKRERNKLTKPVSPGYLDIEHNRAHEEFTAEMQLKEEFPPDKWEIDLSDVIVGDALGQGVFGSVHEGILNVQQRQVPVAIKSLLSGSTIEAKISFLKEASVMKNFHSEHVVRLLGIVSVSEPVLVIMELMAKGDLKNYLRSLRPEECPQDFCNYQNFPFTEDETLQMAGQIAAGMAYLARRKFVHRDLAARNCMVDGDGRVKIGDFGMTRDVYQSDYYRKHGTGPMPVRWMPPESLRDGVFTHASDGWSYGVVLWEILTLGAQPYPGRSNEEVLLGVIAGQVMDLTAFESSPRVLIDLMEVCWQFNPSDRPRFEAILSALPAVKGYEILV